LWFDEIILAAKTLAIFSLFIIEIIDIISFIFPYLSSSELIINNLSLAVLFLAIIAYSNRILKCLVNHLKYFPFSPSKWKKLDAFFAVIFPTLILSRL